MSMGYSLEDAADKAGVPVERYLAWETGKQSPTYKQLETLAERVYRRPVAILLLSKPPEEEPIERQFRSLSNAQISNLPPELRLGLRKAARYQAILSEVNPITRKTGYPRFQFSVDNDPAVSAAKFREKLGFSLSEQMSWRPEEAFRQYQAIVESLGIFVFKMSLPMPQVRAFCLTGEQPVIVLNKQDSRNGMIFSLIHETCHLLLDESDLFRDDAGPMNAKYSKVEDFCNRFAAAFLVPDAEFGQYVQNAGLVRKKVSDGQIQKLSRRYNVSQEVIARKLLALAYITEDFFWKQKALWDAAARAAKDKQNEALKDNESGLDQSVKLLYEKGKPYVSRVINAYDQGLISSSDLSDYLETKLKHLPKIQERLITP